MEYLWNDHKDHPHQHENIHKLCNEMEHPVGNLEMETEAWSEFSNGGKSIASKKKFNETSCFPNIYFPIITANI